MRVERSRNGTCRVGSRATLDVVPVTVDGGSGFREGGFPEFGRVTLGRRVTPLFESRASGQDVSPTVRKGWKGLLETGCSGAYFSFKVHK